MFAQQLFTYLKGKNSSILRGESLVVVVFVVFVASLPFPSCLLIKFYHQIVKTLMIVVMVVNCLKDYVVAESGRALFFDEE